METFVWGTKTYASARDVYPSFPKQRVLNNLFHTYKNSSREEEQNIYLCDRCVLPSDEHKSLLVLIKDDLQGTRSAFFQQRFLLALLASGELGSYMSAAKPLQTHYSWKINCKVAIKTNNLFSPFSPSSVREYTKYSRPWRENKTTWFQLTCPYKSSWTSTMEADMKIFLTAHRH